MSSSAPEIIPFPLAEATDAESEALNRRFNRAKAETLPDDPPTRPAKTVEQMKNVPPFVGAFAWAGCWQKMHT